MKEVLRPTDKAAEEAVRTLISWIGDNPNREGLRETPKRVINAYREFFSGYNLDAKKILGKTFEEVEGYDDMVLLKDMRMESHCEHHMVPFVGIAHVAYVPDHKVAGISKIGRLIDVFAKRLQTQETMTAQIVDAINTVLKPKGVAVLISAKHQCMTTRGVHKTDTETVTKMMSGVFKDDPEMEKKFLMMISC
ncbi:MAG: GTP cyclohydrolase I FolE [Alphaproteobacteria bacterium RIFCSPLOWO2_01_FULL_40_26]|nr:MAG: GTP cyclohydrolase I FolE [Alphaproteobacteria bacterium RIFCSPHIGHO2_02_FULL_40_34]OFW95556.1 MAG: GTP cyclohydrolase I FolE [Alphaproteobacteria bacterium RIFCSPLOWO2_01_FULL_40_26]OFX09608.1 MAG: GTP cyclohydrolase I FolE [Alphaproteobacteria bacterium RIFCSPLOWO2_02_FULL_40_19]OFX12292.1 MAG: GTP cyclohydrolase I FolE [Alphaproteobacteria bacterium RIFCSPLOWO2_12_FULL_40_11]